MCLGRITTEKYQKTTYVVVIIQACLKFHEVVYSDGSTKDNDKKKS